MEIIKYKENPFLKGFGGIKTKKIFVSNLGNDTWINQNTGEVGGTHLVKYKNVDTEQFVKLFSQNIGLTLDLTSAGIKAFNVLIWAVQNQAKNSDFIDLSLFTLDGFLSHAGKKFTKQTFYKGIRELIKAQIIAKSIRVGFYFINPNFLFNGKRIAFTTVLELSQKNGGEYFERDPRTIDFINGKTDSEL